MLTAVIDSGVGRYICTVVGSRPPLRVLLYTGDFSFAESNSFFILFSVLRIKIFVLDIRSNANKTVCTLCPIKKGATLIFTITFAYMSRS